MTAETVLFGVCAGIAATVTMDLLARVSRRIGLTAGAKGIWIGRWYLGMTRGHFVYKNIADAPEQAGEKRAALLGHYLIGAVLGVVYFMGAGWLHVAADAFLVAVGYGIATSVFPWFLLFPALGFGFFGRKGLSELRLFRSSLINHFYYGFGLWWSAWLLQFV